jgi:WD40 repeat protein
VDIAQPAESFRGLLLRHRGRTGLFQRDLAARAGVSLRSVQEWEAGEKFPTSERLQAVIRVLLEAGGLTDGRELSEAHDLWTAAEREAPRMRTPFDEEWFARLLVARAPPVAEVTNAVQAARGTQAGTRSADRAEDWGEAPATTHFVGRSEELAQLRGWVLDERCRLVAVLGMGGIGKTILAARLARTVASSFERVYWRSVRNAPPPSEWLAGAIGFVADQPVVPPPSESERINALLQLLRARPCLLVLDNCETLFEPGQRETRYRAGMEGYGRVLQAVGDGWHQSCLVLTSREAPPELSVLAGGVRELEVHGLGISETQVLLADKQLSGDTQTWTGLVERYGGNGLALRIVGETIRQVYDGDIVQFLEEVIASYGALFGGIRRLLDVQAERLSTVERDVLTRLAVEREPITLAELAGEMAPNVGRKTVIEAIETLRRRSLVEHGERGATFTLQSMVLEYMTDRLVETIVNEIDGQQPVVLIEQPLIKAQAKDYVRESQERLIATPILQQLTDRLGERGPEPRLLALLDGWRARPMLEQGYGPGNVVNLLRELRGNLRGIDLSRLVIRQAYLAAVDAQGGSLAGAHLAETALAEGFSHPTCVALSANGAFLAAASAEVWLWSVADRTALVGLPAHGGIVSAVALTADGRLTASGGGDGAVCLWETKTGRSLAVLQGHASQVWCVALSADGRVVASGDADGTVRLWSLPDLDGSETIHATGRQVALLQGHAGTVWRVALSADGKLVASGGGDGTVRLWETSTGRLLMTLHGHTGGVFGVALSDDGHLVASCGDDSSVRLWETTGGRPLGVLQGHTGVVWRVALSADGELVATGGEDGTVRLWETRTRRPLLILQGHTNEVLGVALSADGRLVASSGVDSAVRLWDATTGRSLAALHGNPAIASDVALSADGALLAIKGNRGPQLWDTTSGQQLTTPLGRTDGVWRVALSADGQVLAGGFGDGTVCLWETCAGRQLWTRRGHSGGVWGVAISADGRLIASGGADGMVRLWETSTGREQATLQGHAGVVWRVALSADGRLMASGGGDGKLCVWETSTARPLTSVHGHSGGVFGVALCADGHRLASSGDDGIVRLWESWTGQLQGVLSGHTSVVRNLALSADGELVASGGLDGVLRVREASTGRSLATIQGIGGIHALSLSADGHLLVSGGSDGTVRLWEASTGALLRTLHGERRYERLDVTGLTGITNAQRTAFLALGAIEQSPASTV